MEKKFTVKEFMYKYLETKDSDKEQFLKDRIVCTYVPFENKVAICENIINTTCFNDGRYVKNTPVANAFLSLNLVNLYTDINIDFKNFLSDYNLMEEYNVVDKIENTIPTKELVRFTNIFFDAMFDVEHNSCSNLAIYTSIKETVSATISSLLDGANEYLGSIDIGDVLPKQKE